MKEGIISLGRLKRIQCVLNTFIHEKFLNKESIFDLGNAIKYISKAKAITSPIPVTISAYLPKGNSRSIYEERNILEMQLKKRFLMPYKFSKPK